MFHISMLYMLVSFFFSFIIFLFMLLLIAFFLYHFIYYLSGMLSLKPCVRITLIVCLCGILLLYLCVHFSVHFLYRM